MLETRDLQLLRRALIHYEELINRPYLHELACLELSMCEKSTSSIELLQISPFPEGTTSLYFSFILNALHGLEQVIGLILCSNKNGYSLYIGIQDQEDAPEKKSCAITLLTNGLKQIFSDITITPLSNSQQFLSELFTAKSYPLLAQASCVPPISTLSSEKAPSFMGNFLELMGISSPFTIFLLAKPVSKHCLYGLLDECYELSQTLSQFSQSARNNSCTIAKNTSKTITHSNSEANGCNTSETKGTNTSCNQGGYTNTSGSTPVAYCEDHNINVTVLQNFAKATVNAKSCSVATSNSNNCTNSYSEAHLNATNKSDSEGLGFSVQNRYVMTAIEAINSQIERIQSLIDTSCFAFNSYFFSPFGESTLRAAYNFAGLCENKKTNTFPNAVNYWHSSSSYYNELFEELRHFQSPSFCHHKKEISSSVLIQSAELNSCFYK